MMTRLLPIVAAGFFLCAQTAAQEADTTGRLGRNGGTPVGFDHPVRGRALTDSLPVLRPETDLVELLSKTPGSFTYLFARPGWPDGWSPYGLSPNLRPLTFNGMPFTHVLTGRPAYNLVPFTLVEQPRLEAQRLGRPYAVLTRLRPFVSSVPITEATYWRGGDGLQSIDAVHAQHRRRPLFGNPGFLNVLGAYSGRATDVDYPGSDLTRGRRVQLRLRYEQQGWSLEVLNLHNRRRIGAHAGVIPPAGDFNAIYRSDLADVRRPEAERRVVRNDLMGTLRRRLLAAGTTSITAYWTAETFRYRSAADTLQSDADRIGIRARQPLAASTRHRLDAHVEAWTERVTPGFNFEAPVRRRTSVHAYLSDSLDAGGWSTAADAGWTFDDGTSGASASLAAARRLGALTWSAEMSTSLPSLPVVYETGFGSLQGLAEPQPGRVFAGRVEAGGRWGPITAAIGVFGQQSGDPVEVFADGDSAAVRQASAPLRTAGLYADLGWRRDARRGFYAVVRPTVAHVLVDGSSPPGRLSDTFPPWSGRARLGARYEVFQGDMDVDLYVDALVWAGFSSRELHPQTGLLIVPDAESLVPGASNLISIVAEVRVRDATLYFVYDNMLSGTSLLPGNLIVPIYPLPARRFRFGVYWPIFG